MPQQRSSAIRLGVVGLIAYCAATAAISLGALTTGLPLSSVAESWPLIIVYVAIMMVPWGLHAYFGGRYWTWAFALAAVAWLCTAYWAYAIHSHHEYMQSRGFPLDGLGVGVAIGIMFQFNMALGAGSLNFGALAIAEGHGKLNQRRAVALGVLSVAPIAWLYAAIVGFGPIFRWLYN